MSYEIETIDVPFARTDDGQELTARICRPKGKGPFPAMLDLHGGAWTHFDHTVDFYWCEQFARRGIVMVSVDFRLAPKHPWPAFISDVRAASKWLHTHAAQFDVNPDAIGAIGGSTGGHLAILLGLMPEDPVRPATAALDTPDDASAALNWSVGLYPIVDVVGRYEMVTETSFSVQAERRARRIREVLQRRRRRAQSKQTASRSHENGRVGSPTQLLRRLSDFKAARPVVGGAVGWGLSRALYQAGRIEALKALEFPEIIRAHEGAYASVEEMREASPLDIVRSGRNRRRPPILIIQGEHDPNMSEEMTRSFEAAYRKIGGEIDVRIRPGLAHGFGGLPSPQADSMIDQVSQFIRNQQAHRPATRRVQAVRASA